MGMLGHLIAVFERADLEAHGQGLCRLVERTPGGVMVGKDAAIGAERQRAQAVPEQAAADLDQRQDAHDLVAAFGEHEMRAVPESGFDHALPAGAMKERRIRMRIHVGIPLHEVARLQRAHRDIGRHRFNLERFGLHVQCSGRNTRSTRSHSKSVSNWRSLPGMRCRLT